MTESIDLSRSIRDPQTIRDLLFGLAFAESAQGRTFKSVILWGAVRRLQEEIGDQPDPALRERLADARLNLGDAAFEQALAQGRELGREQALDYALKVMAEAQVSGTSAEQNTLSTI